ncbi:esterase/lipase family protein [Variovorax sp. JS1663]|uniref:esterase/lipase family protein n=1 Tax=Variovorax sp. JS1663 TaxID=1851577 RepID=UPI000B344EB5|nr:alpha/beta fold hydrolase [Variovorax sp. JS1663]OUM00284.1 permease [Variovorax sp. JS1663]
MVARLQQCIVMAWLLAAFAWVGSWWPHAPVIAIGGLLVLSLAHTSVLGLEFIATRRVSASDPVARSSAIQCARAWLAESWMAPRVFCWQQPFRSHAFPDHLPKGNDRRGVVLVHGFLCNRGFWNPWLQELRVRDHAFAAVNLEPVFGSIDHYVQIIEIAVQRVTAATGRPPVLICHSMGGLAARAWLRTSDPGRVHRIVTIGTPHRGTWLARFSHTTNGHQMRIGGDWMRQAEGDGAPPCLFTCWYSNCDNIVFPISTATLLGADNRLAPGRGHVEMAFVPGLRRQTLDLLEG